MKNRIQKSIQSLIRERSLNPIMVISPVFWSLVWAVKVSKIIRDPNTNPTSDLMLQATWFKIFTMTT